MAWLFIVWFGLYKSSISLGLARRAKLDGLAVKSENITKVFKWIHENQSTPLFTPGFWDDDMCFTEQTEYYINI